MDSLVFNHWVKKWGRDASCFRDRLGIAVGCQKPCVKLSSLLSYLGVFLSSSWSFPILEFCLSSSFARVLGMKISCGTISSNNYLRKE